MCSVIVFIRMLCHGQICCQSHLKSLPLLYLAQQLRDETKALSYPPAPSFKRKEKWYVYVCVQRERERNACLKISGQP